ncbi:MAG: selenoprotein O [Deltaproteobacteria bacterium]|nr:selenoprotein O [Deltaproteobacteria bacterium]
MPLADSYQPAPSLPSLGDAFFDVVDAARFPRHALRYRNDRAAQSVGLEQLGEGEWQQHFAELVPLPRNVARPLAMRYHGHQFRSYNPSLGDGRGFLLAQLLDRKGRLLDLGTKGSGTTPYSRGGDGRLTLKGAVRELLATEMLEALGVYTSKTLSVFETGESLVRYDEPSPTRSAVLVRLSHSHIRFGSFQRLAYLRQPDNLSILLDFTLDNYLPEVAQDAVEDRSAAFLDEVVSRSARLVATWHLAGFVHGVLNTDNMNVTGESFDYGPWRFLPHYDPLFTAAYFDHGGLYAFGRQAEAVHWNLVRLAEALLPISSQGALIPKLEAFEDRLGSALRQQFLARMGLQPRSDEDDAQLVAEAYGFLHKSELPYERLFFDWFGGDVSASRAAAGPCADLYTASSFQVFRRLLGSYEPVDPSRLEHSYFGGDAPCSMLIDEMEACWSPIAHEDSWDALDEKLLSIRAMREALALTPSAR